MSRASVSIALALAFELSALAGGASRAETPPVDAPAAVPSRPQSLDRVTLYAVGQPEYDVLQVEPDARTSPEATDRLVVFREGRPVLDFGLRTEYRLVPQPEGAAGPTLEEGVVENAEISPDGRSAVILSTRFRRPADSAPASGAGRERRPYGVTVVTWVDARRPADRFDIEIKDGRWVKEAIPLSAGGGLVLSTTQGLDAPADLAVYGPGGSETFKVSETEATVSDATATNNGAFVAASVAYPDRPGLPQQGILVLDVLRGTRWSYTWSYGGDGEPISWNLDESGVLVLRLPGKIVRYDRTGAPIGSIPGESATPPGKPAPR